MLKYIIKTLLILFIIKGQSQNSIDDVLNAVMLNNKEIAAFNKYVEANNIQNKSGLNPDNPFMSTDYMIGRPASGGNQLDFLLTQSLDFPSVYSNKKKLSDQKSTSLDHSFNELKQEVLFNSKNICLELIALQKQKTLIEVRINNSNSLLDRFQEMLTNGQISVLEFNKVKVLHLGLTTERETILRNIEIKTNELVAFNGNTTIEFILNEYPLFDEIPLLETLMDSISNKDYKLKWFENQNDITNTQISLSKSQVLPNFEIGYHYQTVLGQTFNGAHFGMSIPLWQQKNTVKAAKTFSELNQYQLEDHRIKHHNHIESKYKEYMSLKQTLEEFKQVLGSINTQEVLDKSLELGEINLMMYLLEIEYFYKIQDKYVAIEKDYQLAISALTKYKL